MTRPLSYLLRMLAFLAAVIVVIALLFGSLITAFMANPLLNSLIVLVELLGIGWNIRQVTRLAPEVTWLETFQRARPSLAAAAPPKLLAPMASMLSQRKQGREGSERFTISAPAMRSLLDSIASRLDESRELSRYMTGLLIFLGLLGTFWGLLLTVRSVGDVITGMSVGAVEDRAVAAVEGDGHGVLLLHARARRRAGAGVSRSDRGAGAEPVFQ
jgi:biopolymer transport protein ExbB/TolQ